MFARSNKEVSRRAIYLCHYEHCSLTILQNTRPRGLRSSQNQTQPAVTAYTYAPGIVGFKGWLSPQARIFPTSTVSQDADSRASLDFGPDNATPSRYTNDVPDRSAMQKRDYPLRVRKTRENLRQVDQSTLHSSTSVIRDFSPKSSNQRSTRTWNDHPLNSDNASAGGSKPSRSSMGGNRYESQNSFSAENQPSSGPSPAADNMSPQPELERQVQRRKSVRKRVVSRMKEGIMNRSRSTTRVMSRVQSGLSIDHNTSEAKEQENRALQRQTEDTTRTPRSGSPVSLDSDIIEPAECRVLTSRASDAMCPPRTTGEGHLSRRDDPVQPPAPSCSPSPDKTPRPARRREHMAEEFTCKATHSIPNTLQIQLSTTTSLEAIDVTESKTVWVMVQAKAVVPDAVAQPVEAARGQAHDPTAVLKQPSLDIVVVMDNSFASPMQSLLYALANSANCGPDHLHQRARFAA